MRRPGEPAREQGDRAHPRLVATTTQLAGTTYELTSDEVVLGRSEDNDIAVDHRSVSKHHAKLTKSGDQWMVSDQGSANGLRVNGEEYSQTVLRKGDILELGHVKLRFVAAGEEYTYSPEAGDPTASPAGATTGGKGLIISLVVVLLAVGLTIAWFTVYSQGSPAPGKVETPASGDKGPKAGAVKDKPAPAAGPSTKKPTGPTVAIGSLLSRAGDLMDARKWDAAMAVYREASNKSPDNQEAKLGLETAEREKASQALYDRVSDTFKQGRVEEAWTTASTFDSISSASAYHAQAVELQKAISLDYTGRLLEMASAALRGKRYRQAASHASRALKITPNHEAARVLLDKARKKAREEGGSKEPTEAKPAAQAKPAEAKPESSAGSMSAGELYKAARNAHRKGDTAGAVALFKKAAGKGSAKAWRQLGTLYGAQGQNGDAIKSWKKYLKLRPGASDAETIRNAIIRYGGTP